MIAEAQRRLTNWGLACRRESERLGLPRISQIQVMIEHVKREDRLRRGVRKTRRTDEKRTANGKATRAARRCAPMIDSDVMEVDHIVASLPDWMRTALVRSYLFGQSDRNACADLRMPKYIYRLWRLAGEESVAERLAKPAIGARLPFNAGLRP